ncbi:hypothetical protein DFJ43DRAFT_1154233 [Lentinula guzmanii]|uniref:Uncharacterized protein n=1 Tax=Lentinula guzmanii TaxID=2804957 RepID=A0AA38N044_9AGAR|nr:hypothetical protein DFJ43DRAFT_1154233 [Lentinula guzmanii]
MERLKEEAAQEAEEVRLAKERKLAEVRRLEEERVAELRRIEEEKIAEEKQVVEEKWKEIEKLAELRAREDRRLADAAEEAEEERAQNTAFEKDIISDDSEDEEEDKRSKPRGVKQKRTIKMIAMGGNTSDPDGDFDPDPEQVDKNPPLPSNSPLQSHPACSRCIIIGRPWECHPQSAQ